MTVSLRRHRPRLVALCHSQCVIYLTFPLPFSAPMPYSSSGIGTGSPLGRQTPQCTASSTTSARRPSCCFPRTSSRMNG